ncbi:MAG: T9SS type A sorting domain-containing protein [Chitinophagales bacterium]
MANANSLGCDSTITLNLTVNPKSTSTVTQTICDGQSVTVGGQTFTTTQVNRQIVLANANTLGCDSTITLNLTVNPLPSTPNITQSNDTLFSNVVIAGATYQWYKATVLVATTSVPYYKLVSSGPYTLIISNNNCSSSTSVSFNAVYTGIKTSKYDIGFLIIPNPNNGQFDLQIYTIKNGQYVMSMYNVAGQELRKETLNVSKGTSTLHFNADHLEKGMYFISVYGEDGMATQTVLIQ